MKLFEILKGNSNIKITWEQASPSQVIGYFTIDNKIIYGIRKIKVDGQQLDLENDLIFIDFGYFLNGKLNYNLLKQSLFPSSVLNTIISEIKKELQSDNIIVVVAKKGEEELSDYQKRVKLYSGIMELQSRRNNYFTNVFNNDKDETVFCASQTKITKLDILKAYKQLSDDWLGIIWAKRILKSLSKGRK